MFRRQIEASMDFASTTGVSTLFHYCPYVPERFADLVARNRIYLSDTRNFNDPWDCRPCFDTSRLDDPAYADKVVNYFYRAARNQTPHIPEEWHRARAVSLRADMAALRAAMVQASDMEAEIAKRYRVFCLTTHPKNILMWSHYAENHTGICLEFSCQNFVFSGAFKVQYAENYPIIDITDSADERVLVGLISKSSAWSYENEYRLIAQERRHAVSTSLFTDDNYLALPTGAIKTVILGCLCPAAVEQNIRAIIQELAPATTVRRLARVANKYDFTFA
jgi:Protein of unknown function (DUF2971)